MSIFKNILPKIGNSFGSFFGSGGGFSNILGSAGRTGTDTINGTIKVGGNIFTNLLGISGRKADTLPTETLIDTEGDQTSGILILLAVVVVFSGAFYFISRK